MVQTILGPDHDLAKRLSKMERDIAALNTRDVLQNATFGPDGTTVPQAFTQLTSLLANQVVPAAGSANSSGWSLTTSYVSYATVTIAVPAGYTKATIQASAYLAGSSNASGGDFLNARTLIAGNAGADSRILLPTTIPARSLSAFGAAVLTGLSGSFNVDVQGRLDSGPGSTSLTKCTITALVLFQR